MDKREGWLAGLKVGDQVFVQDMTGLTPTTIERISPVGRISVKWGSTTDVFSPSGRGIRSSKWYGRNHLEQATLEGLADFRYKQDLARKRIYLRRVQFEELSPEQLTEVYALVSKYLGEEKPK